MSSPSSPPQCCPTTIFYRNFPTDMITRPQWVLWRYEVRDDKPTKVLYQPNGRRAASTRPNEWSSLASVQEARWACIGRWDGPHYDGVGFVFSEHDPFIGIDLDKCRDESWALDLVASCSTYTEVTPSGNGFHLIGLGVMPGGGGRRKEAIEIYDRRRFFTMTGAVFGECPLEPIPVQPQVDALLARWTTAVATRPKPTWTPSLETGEILRRALLARNGDKVSRLYRGDTSGYASGSEADFALLEILAFYTRDEVQLDALFRGSGLMDEKWDALRGSETYGGLTIRQALSRPSAYYRGRDEPPRIMSVRSEPHGK